MDLSEAIKVHGEWRLKFRTASASKEKMDAAAISKENGCQLGKWLYGEGKTLYSQLTSFQECVAAHSAFHQEAGKVAALINAGKTAEVEHALASGSAYSHASTRIVGVLHELQIQSKLKAKPVEKKGEKLLMTFGPLYSVGVKEIDDQHSVLFDIINELYSAMTHGHAQEVVGGLLQKLVKYTVTHFATEEAAMKAKNYPGLTKHIEMHRALTTKVGEFMGRYERGEAVVNSQLLTFLTDWLTNHILKVDKEYSPWMTK